MRRRSLLAGLLVSVGPLLAACSAPAGAPTREWQRVPLPGQISAVTLATSGDDLVVGAIGEGRPRPRLLAGPTAESLTDVPLTPRSPYAFEARWFQIATRDGRIEAVGGARGGAHANYRWSTWSGDLTGIVEQEQPFGVFGSYGAGDLVGVAYAARSPVILGGWQSERTGLDVATWTKAGVRWTRQSSTDTALGSTPTDLLTALAITSRGDGLLLSGSATRLRPGAVRVDPVVWTGPTESPTKNGPWSRRDLPRPEGDAPTEAHSAACTTRDCLVAGATDHTLVAWEVTEDAVKEAHGIPTLTLPDNGRAVTTDDTIVVPTGDHTTVLHRSGATWSASAGPEGTPLSAVVHGGLLHVVTTDGRGAGTLWTSPLD